MFSATAIALSLDTIDKLHLETTDPQSVYEYTTQLPPPTFSFSDFKPETRLYFGAYSSPHRSVTVAESALLAEALLASTEDVDAGFLVD